MFKGNVHKKIYRINLHARHKKKELKGAELSYNKLKDNTNRDLLSGA